MIDLNLLRRMGNEANRFAHSLVVDVLESLTCAKCGQPIYDPTLGFGLVPSFRYAFNRRLELLIDTFAYDFCSECKGSLW